MSSDPTSKYANELQLLSPLFPDWDDQALAFVLADTKGNVEDAALMISDGESRDSSERSERGSAPQARIPRTGQASQKNAAAKDAERIAQFRRIGGFNRTTRE